MLLLLCGRDMEMESELARAIMVYSTTLACLIYSYYVVPRITNGLTRLLCILPVITLFTHMPFSLYTLHLRGLTYFFLLWLGNFKLLLFAFNIGGPLSQPISLARFLISAVFPINVRLATIPTTSSTSTKPLNFLKSSLLVLTKITIFLLILAYLHKFDYKKILHRHLVLVLHSLFMYLALETALAIAVLPAKLFLSPQYELDPQFNEPYLSTSLQDFWSRRWNLMVPAILRPSVYHPLRRYALPAIGFGPTLASFAAILASFAVSGLMHEVLWFIFTSAKPTWEVTAFFILHGVCTASETAMKRALGGKITLPALVSAPLTLWFLMLTANWLFFPPLWKNGVDKWVISEYAQLVRFVSQIVTIN